MESFILLLSEIFEMNPADITADGRFKEYEEWSSLVQLSLIALVNENYGITIGKGDLEEFNTVQDVFDFINK